MSESTLPKQKSEMLKIITVYEKFIDYIEPIADTAPRCYARLRDVFIDVMWRVPEYLYRGAMSGQVSHVHQADGMLATLRLYMRRMVRRKPNLPGNQKPPLTPRQQEIAETKLSETGGMINSWLERMSRERKASNAKARNRA